MYPKPNQYPLSASSQELLKYISSIDPSAYRNLIGRQVLLPEPLTKQYPDFSMIVGQDGVKLYLRHPGQFFGKAYLNPKHAEYVYARTQQVIERLITDGYSVTLAAKGIIINDPFAVYDRSVLYPWLGPDLHARNIYSKFPELSPIIGLVLCTADVVTIDGRYYLLDIIRDDCAYIQDELGNDS